MLARSQTALEIAKVSPTRVPVLLGGDGSDKRIKLSLGTDCHTLWGASIRRFAQNKVEEINLKDKKFGKESGCL